MAYQAYEPVGASATAPAVRLVSAAPAAVPWGRAIRTYLYMLSLLALIASIVELMVRALRRPAITCPPAISLSVTQRPPPYPPRPQTPFYGYNVTLGSAAPVPTALQGVSIEGGVGPLYWQTCFVGGGAS